MSIAQQLAEVRRQLDGACDRLTAPSPASLDACAHDLESAIGQLSAFRPNPGDAQALEQAWHVRRSFLRARKLMESAAEFHENWARVRGAISGGYTVTGEAASIVHQGRICLQA